MFSINVMLQIQEEIGALSQQTYYCDHSANETKYPSVDVPLSSSLFSMFAIL